MYQTGPYPSVEILDYLKDKLRLKPLKFRICLCQGNPVLQDFDIQKEAGGPYIGIERDFPAQVSENYLEIHFFWAGKGTCCVPALGTYGPSISAISAINNNPISVPNTTTGTTM